MIKSRPLAAIGLVKLLLKFLHHMYSVGLDVDTRAYFTAATCAISFYLSLRVYPSSKSFSNFNFNTKFSTNTETAMLSSPDLSFAFLSDGIWNMEYGIRNKESGISKPCNRGIKKLVLIFGVLNTN
jgi:hypothetical protein